MKSWIFVALALILCTTSFGVVKADEGFWQWSRYSYYGYEDNGNWTSVYRMYDDGVVAFCGIEFNTDVFLQNISESNVVPPFPITQFEIPSEIAGCPIQAVGGGGLWWIDSIFYPWYDVIIGSYSGRYGKSNLVLTPTMVKIKIPDGIKSICSDAFFCAHYNNTDGIRFEIEELPSSLESVGRTAFSGCITNFKDVPSGLKFIGYGGFKGCTFENLTISDELICQEGAFSGCMIGTLTISPNMITNDASQASSYGGLIGNVAVDTLVLPNDPEFDWWSVFDRNTTVFKKMYLPQSLCDDRLPNLRSALGSNYRYNGVYGGYNGYNYKIVSEFEIYDGVTNIAASTFSGCTNLTKVTIPSSVRTIGASAFSGCSSLPAIELPNGIKSLNDGVFSSCIALSKMTIPYGVTNIGKSAFSFCTNLVELTIPDSVKVIEASAFNRCTALKKLKLPAHLERIESTTFYGCTALTEIEIPESVVSIGASAFSGCTALTEISLPCSVKQIGGSAFSGCSSLESVSITGNVEMINSSTFYDCASLVEIELPDSVDKIDNYAFYGCNSLVNLRLPNGLLAIGAYAFCNCSNLVNVTFDDRLELIGQSAFQSCTSLKEVEIPCTVTNLSGAFYQCSGLTNAVLHVGLLSVSDFSGCGNLSSIRLPDTLNALGGFSNCDSLHWVVVPPSVTNLYWYSFYSCTNLQAAWIPTNLESQVTERYVFNNCPSDFKVKYYDPAQVEIATTEKGQGVAVARNWLQQWPGKSVLDMAANGRCRVYECYVLGLNPTNATNDFRITSFAMRPDGTIDLDSIVFDPPQDKWNVFDAKPILKGSMNLNGDWTTVPIGDAGSFRFFRIEVELQ